MESISSAQVQYLMKSEIIRCVLFG